MYHDPLISGEFHVADMMPVAIDTIMMRMKRKATTRKLVTRSTLLLLARPFCEFIMILLSGPTYTT